MKVTLQDIAKRLGVAPSTVQRALSGAGGVGAKKRDEIQRMAAEMGYVPNFHASSLKRGTQRIAVILPDTTASNRYFSDYLWRGIDRHASEISSQGIELIPISYCSSPQNHLQIIQGIAGGEYGVVDGIITRGTADPQLTQVLGNLHDQGIPMALIGLDIITQKRLYCVKNYEEMQGRIAADLLIQFGSVSKQRKVIVCGNFAGYDQYLNAKGFEQRIWQSGLPFDIHKVAYADDANLAMPIIRRELESSVPVYAIYTCSTRGTVAVAELLKETGAFPHVRAIGSDVFQESIEYLRQGVVRALLNSRPMEMAYQAIRALTSHLHQPGLCLAPYTDYIQPSVVLPATCPDKP